MSATTADLNRVRAAAKVAGYTVRTYRDRAMILIYETENDAEEGAEALAEARQDETDGRWVLASWNDPHNQYQSSDQKNDMGPEYLYTYAPRLITLRSLGIRSYPTAYRALRGALLGVTA